MKVENGGDLPGDARIILHVSGGKTLPRGGPCERIDAEGLRCHSDGISATWVECFAENGGDPLHMAAKATCSTLKVRKSGVIACVTVEKLLSALADESSNVRVILDSQDHNEGHCLITGIAPENIGLLAVAASAFTEFIPANDIPGLVNA